MSFSKWAFKKKALFKKNQDKIIRVKIKDLTISPQGGQQFLLSFTQIYEAGGYKDKGKKTLLISPYDDGFRISRETWNSL